LSRAPAWHALLASAGGASLLDNDDSEAPSAIAGALLALMSTPRWHTLTHAQACALSGTCAAALLLAAQVACESARFALPDAHWLHVYRIEVRSAPYGEVGCDVDRVHVVHTRYFI
jgi:hypothetical protein